MNYTKTKFKNALYKCMSKWDASFNFTAAGILVSFDQKSVLLSIKSLLSKYLISKDEKEFSEAFDNAIVLEVANDKFMSPARLHITWFKQLTLDDIKGDDEGA